MSSFQSTPPPTDPDSPLKKKRTTSWTDLWLKTTKAPKPNPNPNPYPNHLQKLDRTLQFKDDLLLNIFSRLPSTQINSNSLVCKRWLCLHGRLVTCINLLDFGFLLSGRLVFRFPNLTHVDLINGCVVTPFNSALLLSNRVCSMHIDSRVLSDWRVCEENLLGVEVIDKGLEVLASGCPNLRKLVVIGASEAGLSSVAKKCLTLQELELHRCDDGLLRGIGGFENLQILRVLGIVDGFYSSSVTDIGLTILAQRCRRLVRLELSGCEGSFDGIKAIGQCCQMLEELTLCDHRMDGGWLAALSFCENLKSLKFLSCQGIDPSPGPDEYLGSCSALETLHLERCQLRDRTSIAAMFKVCEMVREIIIQDCWGLDDDMFVFASACRRVNALTLEGCSSLTAQGLESVLLTWNELQDLRIESCKNIKDGEISPALSTLFSVLKELKWRPDTKTLLALNLEGTGMGNKGGKFFRKS